MVTLSPNRPISSNQEHWSCVLDPNLFFSDYGLLLVQSLGEMLELWVARELWHILDNSDFYHKQLTFALPQTELAQSPECGVVAIQNKMQVLKNWETVRAKTPLTHLNLFWIGDRPGESFLPNSVEPQVMQHWEALAQSLDERSHEPFVSANMLTPAFRDTVALAAVLGSAFILTYQPSGDGKQTIKSPEICLILEQWGIPCKQITPLDAVAVIERERLLQLMVSTGLSKLLWAGLHLAVLHLVVPSAFTSYKAQPQIMHFFSEVNEPEMSSYAPNGWDGAQGFWYQL